MPSERRRDKPSARVPPQTPPAPPPARTSTHLRRYGWLYLFVLAVAAFYWPVLSLSGVIWNDFIEQYFPYRIFAATALRSGEFPFWNPYVFCGMPFFADLQTAVLYPFNLLLTLFASREWLSPALFEYQIVLHILLAGCCMYLLARDMGCGVAGGLLAGLVYMFCGFSTTHIFHVTMIHALPWLPLAVLFVRRMLDRGSLLYAAGAALVLCMISFAGHPQILLFTYYWLGAYFLFHCTMELRRGAGVRRLIRPAALFALVVLLGAGLSSVQVLPAAELGVQSERPEMEFSKSCEGSFRPYRFVTLFAPNYYGTPNDYNDSRGGVYWGLTSRDADAGGHYYWETAMYVGVPALVLAVLGAVLVRTPLAFFLAGMSLFALLLAMGDSFFLYWLCYKVLPGFSRFRIPGRLSVMFALSTALLAGLGLQWLLAQAAASSERTRRYVTRALIGAGVVALGWGLLFGMGAFSQGITQFIVRSGLFGSDAAGIGDYVAKNIYPPTQSTVWLSVVWFGVTTAVIVAVLRRRLALPLAAGIIVAAAFIDLWVSGGSYAAVKMEPGRLFNRDSLVRELQAQGSKELFRINMRDSKPGTDDAGGRNLIFHKNQGSVHRLFLMEGYNPLRLKRKFLNRKQTTLDILNVKYRIQVDSAAGRLGLASNPTCLPRARMVYRYEVAPDSSEEKVFGRLYDGSFDHVRSVLLEETPQFEAPASDSGAVWSAKVTGYRLNRIDVDVQTDRPGLLVLSEIFYPAWRAFVDGAATPTYRADYALRAVPVGAGRHAVTCRFVSDSFTKGLIVSLLASALTVMVAAAGVWQWRRRRRGPAAPASGAAA
jgi:hypothetical protein